MASRRAISAWWYITARKLAELALQEADRRKDDFIAVLAHELRNPLASLSNALSLLRMPSTADAQRNWCHAVMDRQVAQMARLLDDLLDVSRLTRRPFTLRSERVDIASVIAQALELDQPLIDSAGHQETLRLPPQPPQVDADPGRLTQLLSNLIVNAAKYTAPGSHSTVRAAQRSALLDIQVSDNGIGIAAEHLPHIFEMFHQVHALPDRIQGGLGIGLSLAQGLVAMHGGTLAAGSDGMGKGSTLTLHSPMPAAANIASNAAANSAALAAKSDDKPDAEPDPEPAAQPLPRPRLPAADRRCVLVVVAQTGWGQLQDRQRTRAAGFDHHLVKPVALHVQTDLLARTTALALPD